MFTFNKIKSKVLIGILFCTFFAVLVYAYKNISKSIPISYFDEEEWIGGSYYFQFLIHGDFNRDIWGSISSEDQPMIAKYLYGAWLYPKYLEQKLSDPQLDYTKYLINNGFYFVDNSVKYRQYKESFGNNYSTLKFGDSGFKDDLISRYGPIILENLGLITYSRALNVYLLGAVVIFIFIFIKNNFGILYSSIFVLFYASNTLITHSSLMAMSEAIFLFLFNICLISMFTFFTNNFNKKLLFIYSIFLGLCFSTKLNGIILYLPFIAILSIGLSENVIASKPKILASIGLLPLIISFIIFVVLNPYTYPAPFTNIYNMFLLREATVQNQIRTFNSIGISNLTSRFTFIFETLSSNKYFFIPKMLQGNILNTLLLILFFTGLIWEIKKFREISFTSRNIAISFFSLLIATICYLQIAWDRYLIYLVFFYIYYLTSGIMLYLRILKKTYIIFCK